MSLVECDQVLCLAYHLNDEENARDYEIKEDNKAYYKGEFIGKYQAYYEMDLENEKLVFHSNFSPKVTLNHINVTCAFKGWEEQEDDVF